MSNEDRLEVIEQTLKFLLEKTGYRDQAEKSLNNQFNPPSNPNDPLSPIRSTSLGIKEAAKRLGITIAP